ncbi:MAG TPA: squalene/phytoene synthase family protein [Chloroflexota bacterium]|nr:squalene/phytoene synthase family protein [Chloroflexota bacterium]
MTELTELRSADAYCRYLTRRHYENFSVISPLLSRSLRRHLARIYAFCRTTDDLGDETALSGAGDQALIRLDAWRTQVEQAFVDGDLAVHPVLIALGQTINVFDLQARPFLNLIQANIQDQTVRAYESWEDLWGYCMLSAAPVGRMVLSVFEIDDNTARRLSDDVCNGLQMANFAQDVLRDRQKGRTYVPQAAIRSQGLQAAIRMLSDRAEDLLQSGRQLEALAPMPLRAQLALYRLGGLEIIRSVRNIDYRTDLERPQVSALAKVRLLPQAFAETRARIDRAEPQHVL